MAQQIINVGTTANDGTGDLLRNGFIKVNQNFTELYTNRISGSGTDNYIPRFNGTNALENSIIFDDGTNVGIGTSTPSYKLTVIGNSYFDSNMLIGNGSQLRFAVPGINIRPELVSSTWSDLSFSTNNAEAMRITSSRNVAIGTTSQSLNGVVTIGQRSSSGNGSSTLTLNHFFGNNNFINFGWFGNTLGSISQLGGSQIAINAPNNLLLQTSSGNVGIGTTSSLYKFHVRTNTNGNIGFRNPTDFNSGWITGSAFGVFNDADNANEKLYIETSQLGLNLTSQANTLIGGNVGIGTTSPSAALDVVSNNTANGINIRTRVNDDYAFLNFKSYNASEILSEIYVNRTAANVASLIFTTNNGSSTTERMRITSTGNVGIGTTSPGAKMTIVGSSTIIGQTNVSARFSDDQNSTLLISHPSFTDATATITGNEQLAFATGSVGSIAERIRITSSGNVGIGTTTPAAKLHIQDTNGGIFFDGSGVTYNRFKSTTSSASVGRDLLFSTQNSGTTPDLYITSSGNVGIGTTTPSTKLEVVGNFKSSLSGYEFQVYPAFDTNVVGMGASSNHNLAIVTNATERMRITSGGQVLVGTTSSFDSGLVCSDAGTSYVPFAAKVGTTSNSAQIYFRNPNGIIGSITTSGSLTSFNVTSDYRLKQDFKNFNGLELLSKIKVYDFAWNVDNSRMNGVIAHELQEVVPYAVTGEKDGEQMQQVDYSKLVPILIQSIQELKEEIETLKNK